MKKKIKKKKKIVKLNREIIGAGPRIREWRKELGIKAFQLAKKLKISQGSISDIENGNSNPSASTILSFYLYTDMDVCWMITGKKEENLKRSVPEKPEPQLITLKPGTELLIKCDKR